MQEVLQINNPITYRDTYRERYRRHYWEFFCEAWKIIEPENELIKNWHMQFIAGELERVLYCVTNKQPRQYDLIINVPPSTLKSTLITIIFPVWCWIHNPSLKFITMSHDESLALMHAVKSRDIIQSEWFQNYFGYRFQLKYDVNKKSEYQNDHYGHRIAVGINGSIIGKHGDILLGDDINNPKKANSQVEIENANRLWDQIVSTRLTNPSISTKIIIAQRTAKNDLTGHCLARNPNRYKHICLPAEASKHVKPMELTEKYDGGLLDPNRLSRQILDDFKVELGSHAYAGQYSQIPVADEGALVDPAWFGEFELMKLNDHAFDLNEPLRWDFFVDGAYTEKEVNAPTAVMCAAKVGGDLYVRHVQRVWMELPDLIKFIPDYAHRNGYTSESRIIIEPKASGLSAAQMLREYTDLNIVIDKAPRDDKITRLKACLPYMEAGRVKILSGADWRAMYVDELKTFPFSQYKDLTDVTTMAVSRAEREYKGGKIFAMEVI